MLFAYWQLTATVYLIFLASCLGQELFRACESDYCNERFVQRRQTGPNNSKEWHFCNDKRDGTRESALLDRGENQLDSNKRINGNDKRYIDQQDLSQRLATESRQETSDVVGRKTISDVTRHLVKSIDERRESQLSDQQGFRSVDERVDQRQNVDSTEECLDRDGTLKRLDNTHQKKYSDNNREDHHKLSKRYAERDIRTHSENSQDKYRQSLRQISTRYLHRSSHHARDSQRVAEHRHLQRKNHYSTLRRFGAHRVGENGKEITERYTIFRRWEAYVVNTYDIKHRDDIAERFGERDIISYSQHIVEEGARKVRQIKERRDGNSLKKYIGRRSEETDIERSNSMRGLRKHGAQNFFPKCYKINREKRHIISRFNACEAGDIHRRFDDSDNKSENKNEIIYYLEISRQFSARKSQLNNREHDLRRFHESETQRDKRSETNSELIQMQASNKLEQHDRHSTIRQVNYPLLRKYEMSQPYEKYERDSAHSDSRSRFLLQPCYNNEEERWQHRGISNTSDHVTQKHLRRNLVINRESPSITVLLSRKEYQPIQWHYKNNGNQQQRYETSTHFKDPDVLSKGYEYLEDKRQMVFLTLNGREGSNNGRNFRLIDGQVTNEARVEQRDDPELQIRYLENRRESPSSRSREEQRIVPLSKRHAEHESQHHQSRRKLISFIDYHYEIMRQLYEPEFNQRSNNARRNQHLTKKMFTGEPIRKRAEFYETSLRLENLYSQHKSSMVFEDARESIRNHMKQMANEHKSRHSEQQNHQELFDSGHSFISKHNGKNYNLMEEGYIPYTTDFVTDTYAALEQAAILAFIILKNLNGKYNSKN